MKGEKVAQTHREKYHDRQALKWLIAAMCALYVSILVLELAPPSKDFWFPFLGGTCALCCVWCRLHQVMEVTCTEDNDCGDKHR